MNAGNPSSLNPPRPGGLGPVATARRWPVTLLWLGILLLTACNSTSEEPSGVIHRASIYQTGERVYARALLHPSHQGQILGMLHQGEPLLAEYRFRFFHLNTLLPDQKLADVTIRRRARFRLVMQRYELEDVDRGQLFFTTDPDEAIRFFAQPRYIELEEVGALEKGEKFRLEVRYRLEHEGVSRMFRDLNRWLSFWERTDHRYFAEYRSS